MRGSHLVCKGTKIILEEGCGEMGRLYICVD